MGLFDKKNKVTTKDNDEIKELEKKIAELKNKAQKKEVPSFKEFKKQKQVQIEEEDIDGDIINDEEEVQQDRLKKVVELSNDKQPDLIQDIKELINKYNLDKYTAIGVLEEVKLTYLVDN